MSDDKFVFTNPQEEDDIDDFKTENLLPDFLKSTDNRKFFDTTFDTLFSQEKSETIAGYIGDFDPRTFRSDTDFYIQEKTKDRENYQFSPTVIVEKEGVTKNQLYYDDIINKLRYQGAIVNNHSRLFDNEYYSFAPHIDIDKFLNFNQYYWLKEGPSVIELRTFSEFIDIIDSRVNIPSTDATTGTRVRLIGNLLPSPLVENQDYFIIVIDEQNIRIAETRNDAINGNFIEFDPSPQSEMEIQFFTRLRTNVEGKNSARLPNGVIVQNGMKIRTFYDEFPEYENKDFRIEGVSSSIRFYDETDLNFNDFEDKDYVTINRNSNDRNSWSRRNRWFHADVLRGIGVNIDNQGKRPIIEFDSNIRMLNFGDEARDDVDVVYSGNLQDITGENIWTTDNVNLEDGMRVLVINDPESSRNNRIYRVFGLEADNSLSFNLELDGKNSDGSPSNGEVVFVKNGDEYGNKYYHFDQEWLEGQKRENKAQNPIFELYDFEGISLGNTSIYPNNNYDGCRLFGYLIDDNEEIDSETGRRIVRNEFNDVMFKNYIEHKEYEYERDFEMVPISGFYFFNKNGEFLNNWNQSDILSRQFIIDQVVLEPNILDDGTEEFERVFELSQVPEDDFDGIKNIEVRLNNNLLFLDRDYIFSDENGNSVIENSKYISFSLSVLNSFNSGDLLTVRSYSSDSTDNIKGYYEIPKNLSNNAGGGTVDEVGSNELVRHFSTILENQDDFDGNVFGINNSRNITVDYSRGENILQHTASLQRLMAINSYDDIDVMDSLRFSEYECRKFYRKFVNKIQELSNRGFDENVSYVEWINAALEELNIGKTSDFPFSNSGVAGRSFIPPSPAFLGITPTYIPRKFVDTTLQNPVKFIRMHDGHYVQSFENQNDVITEQIINTSGGTFTFVLDQSVVFSWEILVEINEVTLIPEVDYTVIGGNSIQFFNDLAGSIRIEYSTNIIDKVLIAFENDVYNSVVDSNKGESIRNYDVLQVTPGYFRETSYNRDEYNSILRINFNKWLSDQNIDISFNTVFDSNNEWTYNYSSLVNDKGENFPGSWRGIFQYYYDTDRPNTSPWNMLGFTEKPEWWVEEYGNAPYTNSNTKLWNDLEQGIIRSGPRQGTYQYLARPGLTNIIPVDEFGDIKTPRNIGLIKKLPSIQNARKVFEFGDMGPLEFQWKISNYYSHALSQTLYLLKPARYIDYFWDSENLIRLFPDQDKNQLVYEDVRQRIPINEFEVFSDNNYRVGVQQIFVDFLKSKGKNNSDLVDAVRRSITKLGYRVGGFIDSTTARFNADNFGLVPNENFNVSLYKSASKKEFTYTALTFARTEEGYTVSGYDFDNRLIPILKPVPNSRSTIINIGGTQANIIEWTQNVTYDVGVYVRINGVIYRSVNRHRSSSTFSQDSNNWARVENVPLVGGISVRRYREFNDEVHFIEYNKELKNAQEIFDIVQGYDAFLKKEGWIFDQFDENSQEKDFIWAGKQLLQWVNNGPELNELLIISPLDEEAKIELKQGYIDSLLNTVNGSWSITGLLGSALRPSDYEVSRFKQEFSVKIKKDFTDERIHLLKLSSKEIEHSVTFDNVTDFGDLIFDSNLGVRQRRLKSFITRSSDWNGTMRAGGFIINNETITSNIDKSANDFRKYYDSENLVIGGDFDRAAKKLVGFNSREYFRNLLFDNRDAFQFYQGFLREKGTETSFQKILRNEFVQTVANLQIQEEWALRIGSYGALSAYSSIDVNILRSDLRSNPQIVKFVEDEDDPRNSIIEINNDDPRFIYKRPNNLETSQFVTEYVKPKLPNAGYLVLDDAQFKVANRKNISTISNNWNINEYERAWIAIDRFKDWSVYRFIENPEPIIEIIDDNGVYKLEIDSGSTISLSENDLIYINDEDNKKVVNVVEVNGDIITIETTDGSELNSVEYSNGETFYLLEKTRFESLDDFFNYTPQKSWNEDDLVFIDKDENSRWVILNPETSTVNDLDIHRKQEKQVKSNNILNSFLYDSEKNRNIIDMIPYHPIQNVLPVSAKENIDYFLSYDPAYYNSDEAQGTSNYKPELAWEKERVGKIWWDLRTVRYIDYDQLGDEYKLNHWGAIFPGTDIEIYQWIKSPLPPNRFEEYKNTTVGKVLFSERSEPKDVNLYVKSKEYSVKRGSFIDVYYFWVKNNDFTPRDIKDVSKTRSTSQIRSELLRPTNNGLPWFTPLDEDTFVVSNLANFTSDVTVLKINFLNYDTDNLIHNEWVIVSEIDETKTPPKEFIKKLKDSLVGYDEIIDTEENLRLSGISENLINQYGTELDDDLIRVRLPVPDENIISVSRFGNLTRPRQSWFPNIQLARANFVYVVNNLLIQRNWLDDASGWETFLFDAQEPPEDSDYTVATLFDRDNLIGTAGFFDGATVLVENDLTLDGKWSVWEFNGSSFDLIDEQSYRANDFWQYEVFVRDGFDINIEPDFTFEDIPERNNNINSFSIGDVIRVEDNGFGEFEIYEYGIDDGTPIFNILAKENGTFSLLENITIPNLESCQALKSIYEGIMQKFTTILTKNNILIAMVREAFKQNTLVDWAFKSSLVNVVGFEEILEQKPIFEPDRTENVISYLREVKPYHVKLREFLERKTSTGDTMTINYIDEHDIEGTIIFDRVSCVADMSLPEDQWTAAERITSFGGNPQEVIPGCRFRGTEIDGKFFKFFENITGIGYDASPYDSSVLGYDFVESDIENLYDMVINGRDFTSSGLGDSDVILDGGNFVQPLLTENRPPELINTRVGDCMNFEVYTNPFNANLQFGYDTQGYDNYVDENGDPVGYDYVPSAELLGTMPITMQDLYTVNGDNIFEISQVPQSNEAIFVYVNGQILKASDYNVNWGQFRPSVEITTSLNDGDRIKILSFTVGGRAGRLEQIYKDNIEDNVFSFERDISPGDFIYVIVNGNKEDAEWTLNGGTGLEDNEFRVPNANVGDTVYAILMNGSNYAEMFKENFVYNNVSLEVERPSRQVLPDEIHSLVYKNGKRLNPPYIRYFDPVSAVNIFPIPEKIRNKDFLKSYLSDEIVDNDDITLNEYDNVLTTSFNVTSGQYISFLNDINSEFHFDENDLYIHTVAYGNVEVSQVDNNTEITINTISTNIVRPDNTLTVPLAENGEWRLEGDNLSTGSLGLSGTITINSDSVTIETTDDRDDIITKINDLDLPIEASIDNDVFILSGIGINFELSGDWNILGITNGEYNNVIKLIQDSLGMDYRVNQLDNRIKIIYRVGDILNISSSSTPDLTTEFGLMSSYDNDGSLIKVITLDDNTLSEMRTEVFQGVDSGQYAISRSGFNSYYTVVSAFGDDSIVQSDFKFGTVTDSSYDENIYNYIGNPGILYGDGQNQNETIVITTYNGEPTTMPNAFRIFKTLQGKFTFAKIDEEKTTQLVEPLRPGDDEIVVKDATILSQPKKSTNTPGSVFVGSELIQYFEVDTSITDEHKLSKLIRGSKGTPFGYVNEREFNNGDLTDEYIKVGTLVVDYMDSIHNIDYEDVKWREYT